MKVKELKNILSQIPKVFEIINAPKVLITWLDSKGITSEWEFMDELEPLLPCEIHSIGFLIDDNEKYKTIAQGYSDTQIIGRLCIPACSIVETKNL